MEGFSLIKNNHDNINALSEEKRYFNSDIKANSIINVKQTSNKSINKISLGNDNLENENLLNSNTNLPFIEKFRNTDYQINNSNNNKSSISVFDNDRFLIENLSKSNPTKTKNYNKPEKIKEEMTANKNSNHNNHLSENYNLASIESNFNFGFNYLSIKDKCDICTKEIDEEVILSSEEKSLIKCRNCNIIIHRSCNDEVEFIKEDSCNKCLLECRNPQISNKQHLKIKCHACEKTEGSMININSKWIHFLCLSSLKKILNFNKNINNENEIIKIVSNNFLEALDKIQRIKPTNCRICSKRSCFTVKCNSCDLHSHAYCAYLQNLETLIEKKLSNITCFSKEENSILLKSSLSSNLKFYNLDQSTLNQFKNISNNYMNMYEFEIKCNQKHSINYSKPACFYEIKKFDNKLKEKDSNRISNQKKLTKDRFIMSNDSNYKYLHLNVNSNKKTIDNNGRIKDCIPNNNNGQYSNNTTTPFDLNSLSFNNEIKHSHSNFNENKIIKLQSNDLFIKRNSEKDFNKEDDKILENDKIILNSKTELEKHSENKKRMRKNSKKLITITNKNEKDSNQKESFNDLEEESDYFNNKKYNFQSKNLNKGKTKKKHNKLISANLRDVRNSKHKLASVFDYEQNIKSINIKHIKEKYSKINSDSIIDFCNKNFSEEELIEQKKKYFSTWDFVADYFKKFEFDDLNIIKSESLDASSANEENEILNQFVNFWFAKNKIEANFFDDYNALNLKNFSEDKNIFMKNYQHNLNDNLYNKNEKFLKLKRNSRVCKVRKNDKDLLLFYEISNLNDIFDKYKSQDNYNANRFLEDLELNEISRSNSPAEMNNVDLSKETFNKVKYFSKRSFQKDSLFDDKNLNKSTVDSTLETNLQKENSFIYDRHDKTNNNDNLNDSIFKSNSIENIFSYNDLNTNITVSDCFKKIIINKSILDGIQLNPMNSNYTNDIYNKKKRMFKSIKLKSLIEIKPNEKKAFDLQDCAIRNIQEYFNKVNKQFLSNKAEDSQKETNELSLDNLSDIDRIILINEEMLKKVTNDNKFTVNNLAADIKKRILDNKNQIEEKLIKQTKSLGNVLVYENKNECANYIIDNDFTNKIIDFNKIKEIDKIFYLPFTLKKNKDATEIRNLSKFKDSTKDLKIFIENSNDTKLMELEDKQTKETSSYINPGIIEIKNYDIMEKENFDLINNSFLTEYYSNNRFNHIKRRLKLGFTDKRIETIIKSRFTVERLNQIIGEHTHESLISFNKKENQSDSNYFKIKEMLEKSDSDCCICMYSELDDTSVIVFCDCCNVGMHLECYGIANVDDIYLCDVCVYILKNFSEINFTLKNKEFIRNKLSSGPRLCLADSALEAYASIYAADENRNIKKRSDSIIQIDLVNNGLVDNSKNNAKDHSRKYKLRLGKNQNNPNYSIVNLDSSIEISNSKLKIPFDFNETTMENNVNIHNDRNNYLLSSNFHDFMDLDNNFNGNKDKPNSKNKLEINKGILNDKPKLKSVSKSEKNCVKIKNSKKESENKNANSILNHIKCIICFQSRGPMKNINQNDGDWAHIICLIFSLNYQIYDYGKIRVKKLGLNDNHIENFINNYSFYFKQENFLLSKNININKSFSSALDFFKENQENQINTCEICTASIGEVFPCLLCLEELTLQNNKIPHFHVLCAYLNGNKMEVLENEEKISYENYYNFFLKREELDKYLIKRSRIYAKINCAYHSLESGRDSEVQRTFRNLIYHKETFLYKDFKNKFEPDKKDKNSSFKPKKKIENDDDIDPYINLERNNSTKKSITNYGLKQSDNSTEGKIFLI